MTRTARTSRTGTFAGFAAAALAVLTAGCGTASPTATATAAAVHGYPDGGRPSVSVAYDISCPRGQLFELLTDVREGGAIGTSRLGLPVHGTCTGSLQRSSTLVLPVSGTLHSGIGQVTTLFAAAAGRYPTASGTGVTTSVVFR